MKCFVLKYLSRIISSSRIVSFLVGGILYVLICTSVRAEGTVSVSSVVYPPLVFQSYVSGFGEGMLRDIVSEAYRAVEYDVKYDLLPMSRNVWSIDSKVSEGCLGAKEWFGKRSQNGSVDCIDIINLSFVAFYKVRNFPQGLNYDRLDELRKYTFGNVRGSSSQSTLDAAGLQVDLTRKIELNFLKLNAERFDFAVSFIVAGNYLIKDLFPGKQDEFSYMKKPLLFMPLSMIFMKDKSMVRDKFITGLEVISRNGTYLSILERYYGAGRVPYSVVPEHIRNKMPASGVKSLSE